MKFVLLGQSLALIAAARFIRSRDTVAEIVILSCDGKVPYDRSLLPQLISKKIKERDLFREAEDFLQAEDVALVLDKEVTRINFNRRRIFLSDKQNMDYDVLIMADAPQVRMPNLKGIRRTGIFHLARLDTVKGLLRHLPFIETAVVEINSVLGVETALVLKELGKDVLAVSGQERLLEGCIDGASSQTLSVLLEKRGIRTLLNNSFEDFLGDSDVKAVRFKSGKVVACEAVVFDDPPPDLRFLADGDLVIGQRIPVTSNMRTNMENVFAVDVLCQMELPKITGNYSFPSADAERQGEVAALAAFGQPISYDRSPASGSALLERIFTGDQLAEAGPGLEPVSAACPGGGPDPAGGSGG